VHPVQALRVEDPERIGDFTVLGRLGRGAMGTVYLGRSAGGRRVAVKVARPELAEDARFRERFRNEVAMARAVGGFWTAAVVDADPDAHRPWLATEYVPGPTLHDVVAAHGPMPEPALRRLVAGLAEALLAIHATGLVHRDLKPSNVLLGADGPRVIDFGIAKAVATTGLTVTGMLIGTPGYLSPEQIAGGPVTAASDVFALGSVLVHAATGDGPFGSGDAAALMYRVVNAAPRLDGVPAGLRPLASRCLDRDPQARPTPADILAEVGRPDTPDPAGTALWPPAGPVPVDQVPPTKPYTVAVRSANGNRAVFRTSRLAALVGGVAAAIGAVVCLGIAGSASDTPGQGGLGLLFFVGFVLLAIPAVRLLRTAIRSRRWLEVSGDGLTIGAGTRRRRLAWSQVARVRVVEIRRRPWLVVWLTDPNDSLGGLAGPYRGEHGGYRVFPVGHERRRRAREHEVRELRAALGWYGRTAYDWSP
jgi:eukaryotic-like serine/threonine-protein kinase